MTELAFLLLGYALEHVLASVVIALLVLAICRVKAITPGAKAGFLLAALMLAVFGPLVPVPEDIGASRDEIPMQTDAARSSSTVNASGDLEARAPDRDSWAPGNIEVGRSMALFLILLWSVGAAWQLTRWVKAQRRLRGIIAASKRSRALEHDHRRWLPTGVEIRLCGSFGPAVVGVRHPKILLPEALVASLPDDALRAVLLHEVTHLRRNDVVIHAAQKIVEAVFWWNPLIRWMGGTLDTTREIACDIEASRGCRTPADYADALLTAIEHIIPMQAGRYAPALGVADASRTLDQRIDGIIEARTTSGLCAGVIAAGVLLAMTVAWAGAKAASRPLAPVPARSVPVSERPVETKSARPAAERPARAAPSANTAAPSPRGVPATSSSAARVSAAPAIAREAPRQTTAAPSRAPARRYPPVAAVSYDAVQANEDYNDRIQLASEAYQYRATLASEDYQAAANTAGETYQQQYDVLGPAASGHAFETALARHQGIYDRAMSAARAQYALEMKQAQQQFDAATRTRPAR